MKKRYLIIIFALLLMLPTLYQTFIVPSTIINGVDVKGRLTNEADVAEVITVLEQNIQAANEEDLDVYVSTLIESARSQTSQEMQTVFDEFDIKLVLESIDVLEQTDDLVKLRVQQRATSDSEEYRDHIATVGITFIKVDGQWLIAESMMEDTQFI